MSEMAATSNAANASSSSSSSFATALSNVRRFTTSSLPHQSKPAQLLVAIESAISSSLPSSSSSLPHSPTAYFASLLQCLEKACADEVGEDDDLAETENMGQGALIPACLFILAIVISETPTQVVLSKLSPLMECLLPLYESAMDHPPALRSIITINTAILLIAPPGVLNSSPLLKRSWNYILELNLDPRPKVRHLAQEGVRKVLVTPIPPKVVAGSHPYLSRTRDWVTSALQEETKAGGASSKKKARFADGEDVEGKKGIWVVQGLRGWAAVWGEESLSSLCSLLLSLPPNPHLTPQVYGLLAHLLSPPPADVGGARSAVLANLPTIIDSLLNSPPDLNSNLSDIPEYLSALTSAMIKLSIQDTASLHTYLQKAWNLIFNQILLGPNTANSVMRSASESLGNQGLIRYCVSDDMILAAVNYHRQGSDQPGARKKQKTPFVSRIIVAIEEAFNTHALKMAHLLPLLTALISRLRLRVAEVVPAEIDTSGIGRTAAEELLSGMLQGVGDLRLDRGFEAKDQVDDVVGMAIEVIGVEGVLSVLPLNIEPDGSGNTPQPGRAHLLPLIRSRTTNDSLAFFAMYFRPLSERIFERKVKADESGKGTEAKIWEVIVGQIWDCFRGFCEMPRDLKEGLTPPFLGLLTNLLYTQSSLLSSLLRSLSVLVSSTQTLLDSTATPETLRRQFGTDQTIAKENMEYLRTLAKDMVSVLLNVFSKLAREQRGMVSEVIALWVGIMKEEDLLATYKTVTTHLSANLNISTGPAPGASPISHTMLDLLIVFVPHLPAAQSSALFTATASPTMLEHADATVQKKSYRLLNRLLDGGKMVLDGDKMQSLVEQLNEVAGGVGPGAQRDRLQLIAAIVEALPQDRLHLIPELLSEAVLGTKEVNEKARDSGFDLLVVMGNKMAQGGTVRQAGEEEMSEEVEAEASIQEYITMVAAGLTGTTPHMISASINALSRLLFEFKDAVPEEMISELVSTVAVFINSKNREIVKSALGFVKVAMVALPASSVSAHLNVLVPALLGWVHDHKNHFKTNTVHIFERMIRKFGYDSVIRHAPEGGERKVLENIRKRKEKAKKKKAVRGDVADEDGQDKPTKAGSGNAFDDVLYNSDSDEDASDDEGESSARGRVQGQGQGQGKRPIKPLQQQKRKGDGVAYIRNEGDQPMDLLSRSIAGGVSRSDPSADKKRRLPGQDASHFTTDKFGKMVINESDDEQTLPTKDAAAGAGTAFVNAQKGTYGMSRDARGNLRFNKNNKRSRGEDREEEAAMDLDELIGDKKKPAQKKRREVGKLGEEFRAKRAGGDIKRQGGPDPYSYVSLGQASKQKKGQNNRVSLTNKKKGSRA